MKFLVLAVIALLSVYGCVAESEAQADAPFVSLMEAEAQSLERTKSHLQQQIAQTMARQMALQKESAIRSASDLAAMKLQLEHKRLQARRQHLLNEMKLSSSALNKLGHGELQIDNTYGAKHEPAAPSLVQLSDTPRLELTDEPQPQPQPQPHAQAQTPAHSATRRLTFPTAAGDMECECRMAARRHEAATHAPAREHAPAHASAPAQKPIKGAADKTAPWIHAPVDGSLPPVFGLPCFENCQEYKCRKDFPTYGFDHFHECVISCVEKCYKGDENALKVAEVAFHHQEVVNGKVAKRLKEEFIEGLH